MEIMKEWYESTEIIVIVILIVWTTLNLVIPVIVDCCTKKIAETFRNHDITRKSKFSRIVGIVIAICLLGSVKFWGDNTYANATKQGQEQEEESEQELQRSIEYYIINAENELYSYEEINVFSSEELYKLRNGVYARRGLCYKGVLGIYYEEFNWYNPRYNSEDQVSKYITYNEWKLIDLVKRIEEERKNVN